MLASGLAAIGITTALSLVLGELYLRRRLAVRGHPRVILWTLPLAIGSVVLARVSGAQPAYLYGVVGAYAGAAGLSLADQGRMTQRGSLGLLALAVAAWILRVPVQPDGALPQGGVAEVLDTILVGVFVAAVEAVVIGLIPLRFLPGERLRAWSTWRWAAIWAVAIVLFAHVVLYPVSDAEPDPTLQGSRVRPDRGGIRRRRGRLLVLFPAPQRPQGSGRRGTGCRGPARTLRPAGAAALSSGASAR